MIRPAALRGRIASRLIAERLREQARHPQRRYPVAPIVVDDAPPRPVRRRRRAAYAVIGAISVSHFLNDLMQSLIPSIYPILKDNYALDFSQIGLITLAFMFTSSLLQPLVAPTPTAGRCRSRWRSAWASPSPG